MGHTSFLKNKVLYSPLASQSALRPQGRRGRPSMGSSLMLTSLVDAFSILVIFLMMNSSTDQSDFQVDKGLVLPKATQAVATLKTATVKLNGGKLSVNDKPVTSEGLAAALKVVRDQLKASGSTAVDSLVVIADRDQDFLTLNPIIVAGSRVGFSEFKFAVERNEK